MLTNTTEAAVREFSAFPKKELRWSSSLLLVAQYTPLLSDSGTISYIADDPAPQQRARDFLLRIAKSEVRQVPSAWFNNLVQANIDRIAARNYERADAVLETLRTFTSEYNRKRDGTLRSHPSLCLQTPAIAQLLASNMVLVSRFNVLPKDVREEIVREAWLADTEGKNVAVAMLRVIFEQMENLPVNVMEVIAE